MLTLQNYKKLLDIMLYETTGYIKLLASFCMNCLHLILRLTLRYEDLQDVLVHGHAEASVLTLHCETLPASSCSASTVQPLP